MKLALWTQPNLDFRQPADAARFAERVERSGVDVVFPCVKTEIHRTSGRSYALFPTERAESFFEWDALAALVEALAGSRVEVHPWLSVFYEGDSAFLRANPHARCQGIGHYEVFHSRATAFACPAQPLVQERALALIGEVLAYPVAGIHLDFFRYPAWNTCACDFCRERYRAATGLALEEALRDAAARRAWVEQRRDTMSDLVTRIAEQVRGAGRQLTSAVFADYPASIYQVGQDWLAWLRAGWVDVALPMNYRQDTTLFQTQALGHGLTAPDPARVWQGIAAQTDTVSLTPAEMRRQIEITRGLGLGGASVFHLNGLTDEHLREIRAARE